jgi:hypothetical protein
MAPTEVESQIKNYSVRSDNYKFAEAYPIVTSTTTFSDGEDEKNSDATTENDSDDRIDSTIARPTIDAQKAPTESGQPSSVKRTRFSFGKIIDWFLAPFRR